MDRTHETFLKDMLRDVMDHGTARINAGLLYRWYDAQRINKRIWNDIAAKWDEVCEEYGEDPKTWRIAAMNYGNGHISFVCIDPENAAPDEKYIKPLREEQPEME